MSRTVLPALFAAVTLLVAAAPPAHAELMIGGYPPSGFPQHPLTAFARDAVDGAAPDREIIGISTQLQTPSSGSYEPIENVIYVADQHGKAVRVYPALARGDVAPIRVIQSASLQQTRAVVPVVAHDELIAIASNCCISVYPRLANGSDVNRVRGINWGGGSGSVTQLNNPASLIYLPGSDEIALIDYDTTGWAGKVLFFARSANGNAAPSRVLKNIHTTNARGIAHDPVRGLLFLLVENEAAGGQWQGRILVYPATASGADVPLYTIEGDATQLGRGPASYFTGIGIDQGLQRLMIGISGGATNRVVSLALAGVGNVAPVQQLSGPTLSIGSIGTPFAVPGDHIHDNGFDD